MRNRLLVALAFVLSVGLAIAEAQARGGGKGPGRIGGGPAGSGGARGANIGPGKSIQPGSRNLSGKVQSLGSGNSQGNAKSNAKNTAQNKVSQLKTNFTAKNQPFTPAWYANHPRAWQYMHPHADAWTVASLGAVGAWLGWTAGDGGTVYTSDADDDEGQADVAGDFLPLGVFGLAPQNEKDASALVQLALNKQGQLFGNYFDVLTGKDQTVSGKVDKKTQRAAFTVGSGGGVWFETPLANLTQAKGAVTLTFSNGQTRQWTLARFDDQAATQAN